MNAEVIVMAVGACVLAIFMFGLVFWGANEQQQNDDF